jgi:hypothetical protein
MPSEKRRIDSMIVYHSAFQLKEEFAHFLGNSKIRLLRSFHGNKKTERPAWCSGLFLDSGAFSAYRSGALIDLRKYIKFLREHAHAFDAYASLDVIGNPKRTQRNQEILDAAGLSAIPTYHIGEPVDILKKILDQYEYIALGGMVPFSGSEMLREWVRMCWHYIGARVRVHGFGLTDLSLAKMFPWYSIDSTTASRAGRCGVIISPWGQLRVSSGIKIKTAATICSPEMIKRIMLFAHHAFPDLKIDWPELSGVTIKSSQLRTAMNARFIEGEVRKPKKAPEYSQGFFDYEMLFGRSPRRRKHGGL